MPTIAYCVYMEEYTSVYFLIWVEDLKNSYISKRIRLLLNVQPTISLFGLLMSLLEMDRDSDLYCS